MFFSVLATINAHSRRSAVRKSLSVFDFVATEMFTKPCYIDLQLKIQVQDFTT